MADRIERVCVVGLGYVGIPTAAILAMAGLEVVGVDIDLARVKAINAAATPISEPDLAGVLADAVRSGRLQARQDVVAADAFIVAVPTPLGADRSPDLRHLHSAAKNIAGVLQPGNLVVLESTSPVGTTEAFCEWLATARPDLTFPHAVGERSDVRVAYCPERILPGRIVAELVVNERIVGGVTPACAEAAIMLYKTFVMGNCSTANARTAEMVKLAENAYRDVNIAFANEMSVVCEALGIDAGEMIELANRHPRVDVLRPGPGVGGHCIAIDPWFVVHANVDDTPLIRAARQVNDGMPQRVVDRVLDACRRLDRPAVACLGLSYKADIGDLRESPSVVIVERLSTSLNGRLMVVEPYIASLPDELANQSAVDLVDLGDALTAANVVVLLTDHQEFRKIDTRELAGKTIVDTRGIWRK